MEQEIQGQIESLIGNYGWMFITGILLLLFRSAIEGFVEGFKVFVGNDLNTDDVITINGQPARVVRVGIFKNRKACDVSWTSLCWYTTHTQSSDEVGMQHYIRPSS